MESVKGPYIRPEGRRSQRLKSVSESSTNDSGYSSEVFTSPESSRGSLNLGVPAETSVKGPLSFDGPATRARLASTPCESSIRKNQSISFPSPCLDAIKKSCLSMDSLVSGTSTAESEVEITSTKMSDSSLNAVKGQQSLKSQRTKFSSKASVTEMPLLKPILRAKKPVNILLRILREADYLLYEVLKHLCPQDLINVSHVNRQLRNFILGHKELSIIITKRRKECERIGKENLKLKRLGEGAGTSFVKLSPRKQLGEIQNQPACEKKPPATVSCPSPPLSDRFIEEGKKLPQGEELQKCVKCKAPAKVYKAVLRAVCSSKNCLYEYCMRCFLPVHRKPQECSVLKPRARNGAGMFSKKCKKNLRRL
ncbi:F-box only protein 5-like [Macrobrachium nipponense]|uniref:F-box only protein 5-like n=1 Tax=Macrobrachium nipponense TaxID=159736 RepID=UPI0030C83422